MSAFNEQFDAMLIKAVRKYGNKHYRMYNGTFSELKCAGLFYELLKKAGLPQGTQAQLRIYDINSQKWKWLGDWKDL